RAAPRKPESIDGPGRDAGEPGGAGIVVRILADSVKLVGSRCREDGEFIVPAGAGGKTPIEAVVLGQDVIDAPYPAVGRIAGGLVGAKVTAARGAARDIRLRVERGKLHPDRVEAARGDDVARKLRTPGRRWGTYHHRACQNIFTQLRRRWRG